MKMASAGPGMFPEIKHGGVMGNSGIHTEEKKPLSLTTNLNSEKKEPANLAVRLSLRKNN